MTNKYFYISMGIHYRHDLSYLSIYIDILFKNISRVTDILYI